MRISRESDSLKDRPTKFGTVTWSDRKRGQASLYWIWTSWSIFQWCNNVIARVYPGDHSLLFTFTFSYNIFSINPALSDYLKIVDYTFKKYGALLRFWLGTRLYLFLADPRLVQSVLYSQECLNRDDVYDFVSLLGDGGGLLTLKGQTWKNHRKFLNPCFSLKILQSYMPIFNEQSCVMMDNMAAKAKSKESFNFYEYMDACTLDMICRKFCWPGCSCACWIASWSVNCVCVFQKPLSALRWTSRRGKIRIICTLATSKKWQPFWIFESFNFSLIC